MNQQQRKRLEKVISLALRHRPERFGLVLDAHGWVHLEDLVAGLRAHRFPQIAASDIADAISHSNKQRHEIVDGRIRALYGHSVAVRIVKDPAVPPEVLFHGTSEAAATSITRAGLLPMNRQYVHLSEDQATAQIVGARHVRNAQPVVLFAVDTVQAQAQGCQFYYGNDTTWLADAIPAEFLQRVTAAAK